MATIMITCPTTGKEVSTGMASDHASWKTAVYRGNAFTCSACGQTHTWDKDDARLRDDRIET